MTTDLLGWFGFFVQGWWRWIAWRRISSNRPRTKLSISCSSMSMCTTFVSQRTTRERKDTGSRRTHRSKLSKLCVIKISDIWSGCALINGLRRMFTISRSDSPIHYWCLERFEILSRVVRFSSEKAHGGRWKPWDGYHCGHGVVQAPRRETVLMVNIFYVGQTREGYTSLLHEWVLVAIQVRTKESLAIDEETLSWYPWRNSIAVSGWRQRAQHPFTITSSGTIFGLRLSRKFLWVRRWCVGDYHVRKSGVLAWLPRWLF